MTGRVLKVNPPDLRAQSAVQSDVATFVAGMGAGAHLHGVGAAMPALTSAAACRDAAGILDNAAAVLTGDLAGHADKVSAAADTYQRADAELGKRLKRFMQ